jgi:hypothetical protein
MCLTLILAFPRFYLLLILNFWVYDSLNSPLQDFNLAEHVWGEEMEVKFPIVCQSGVDMLLLLCYICITSLISFLLTFGV